MQTLDVVVVGGGITGLTAAHTIRHRTPHATVALLEADPHVGGIVGAARVADHVVDIGPHGFIDNGSDTRALVDRLGLAEELISATPEAAKINLLDGPRLHRVPDNAAELLRTTLLTWRGKLRLCAEPLVARVHEEESAVDFVSRRFGTEVAERFAVPAVRGVVGGDAASFSIDGEFPMIKQLERRYGSVLVGAVINQIARRRADPVATRLPSFAEFGRRLKTFRGTGMQVLIDALAAELAPVIRTGTTVEALDRGPGGWTVTTADGTALAARHVVVAVSSDAACALIAPHSPELSALLGGLPHPDIRVLALAYERSAVPGGFPGIGFIATPDPGGRTQLLGAIHASTIFPEQAPPGRHLIRTLSGGLPDSPILTMPHDEAVAAVHDELRTAFGILAPPVFAYDHLWRRPIPTYPVGHRTAVARLLGELRRSHGLHLAGNSYFGVGVNDCVRDGFRVAGEVHNELTGRPAPVTS